MSPLDNLGISTGHLALWVIVLMMPSILAFALVCTKEKDAVIRIIMLIVLIAFPILAPLAVFLGYLLWRPSRRKKRG